MLNPFFPNIQQAIPKTNEERMMNEPKTAQALGGSAVLDDPDDEPGLEMAKGARVWRTYVKETDRWDKEIVDGRNNSLDVLLIFAALFSAVSTAFIIESLKDLKEDYTKSSAEALLAIGRKLDAISMSQPVTPLPVQIQGSSSDAFSPPHASVVVNALWLLSLSLSVAVSLIAMLAKEWCYKFMSGRSGQAYDQGRRRQQKWNGMERWKMQEMLTYLPGLMHIALLLFAVGLCIYLWGVNVGVAIPVTAVTSVATCLYTVVTILPWFDRFCPYSTPATNGAAALWAKASHILHLIAERIIDRANDPEAWSFVWMVAFALTAYLLYVPWRILSSAFKHLCDWIKPASSNTANRSKEDAYTPMDAVTSQMLAWMIVNCDDSQSVNVALQAIAGARAGLPHAELAKNEVLELVEAQLQACVQKGASSGEYRLKNADMLYPALRYGRAYSMLASGDSYKPQGSWTPMNHDSPERQSVYGVSDVVEIQTDLIRYAESVSVNSGVLAAAWAGCIHLGHSRHWETGEFCISSVDINPLATLLSRHISREGTQIPEPALAILLDSCPYYMIGRWPWEADHK
ncbi:hypothetical protein FRC12_010865 [Ceratobasidium sp. 428]|nr:hypothetical protein FRC12_010865 [Ceratobasidium sp. 428]